MAGFYGTALERIGRAIHAIVINAISHGNRLKNYRLKACRIVCD